MLAIKRESQEELKLNFDALPNLPPPQALLVRLAVLVNVPYRQKDLGTSVLDAMGELASVIHPG